MHNDKILDNSSFIQINNLSLKGKFVSSILLSDDSFSLLFYSPCFPLYMLKRKSKRLIFIVCMIYGTISLRGYVYLQGRTGADNLGCDQGWTV